FANVATYGIITAGITMLIPQTFEDTPIRVPLLGRRLLIVGKNLFDNGMKGTELACRWFPRARIRLRLRAGQYFANLAPRMVKSAGDGTNAHAIPMGLTNARKVVHRKHPWLPSS